MEDQIQQKKIKVLVFNSQTITNLTTRMKERGNKAGIPIVGVSETMTPIGTTFQDWQVRQLKQLTEALGNNQ